MYWIISVKLAGILGDAGTAEPEGLVIARSGVWGWRLGRGLAPFPEKEWIFRLKWRVFVNSEPYFCRCREKSGIFCLEWSFCGCWRCTFAKHRIDCQSYAVVMQAICMVLVIFKYDKIWGQFTLTSPTPKFWRTSIAPPVHVIHAPVPDDRK